MGAGQRIRRAGRTACDDLDLPRPVLFFPTLRVSHIGALVTVLPLTLVVPAQQAAGPSFIEGLLPFIVLAAIFYFLIYRPQANRQKEHDKMVAGLKKDDRVVMNSGLHGRITEVGDDTLVLDAGSKTRLTFDKTAVGHLQGQGEED